MHSTPLRFLIAISIVVANDSQSFSADEPAVDAKKAVVPVDEDEETSTDSVGKPVAAEPKIGLPERWLLVCCGLPGDDGHRERLTEACRQFIAVAEPVLGVTSDHLRVLAGDEEMRQTLAENDTRVGICTQDSVEENMAAFSKTIPEDGSCWIVILGHAHLHGTQSQFNVLDSDFDQTQFSAWAKPLNCREQVFLITTPISGFWTRPLRSPSRVVISATEADLEYTATEMPYALAAILSGTGEHSRLNDVDGDNVVSLLDLYLATNLEIHGRFQALERLQTEHASLDDNGDGRGREVQLPYLPDNTKTDAEPSEEEADVVRPVVPLPKPISNSTLDGYRSRSILLRKPR